MTRFSFAQTLTRLVGAAALTVLFVGIPHLAHADAVTDANLAAKIESAKTPADHEAIAQYFTAKAVESDKAAAMHESMLKTFKTEGGKPVGGKPYEVWQSHCKSFIADYKEMAADYRNLAALHEAMAKATK